MKLISKISNLLGIKIIDRYIISEFWLPFLSGAAIITGVWLSADQIRQVFRLLTIANAPISLALNIIGLHLPEIFVVTIPIGVLWGSFLVFSRLNNDSEIIAMRTCGFSISRILKPVAIFGLMTSFACFFLNELVVPVTGPLARKLEVYSLYKNPFAKTKRNFLYVEKGRNSSVLIKRIFYSFKYNPKKDSLSKVVILDFTKDGLTQIYTAKHARWLPLKGGWELKNGVSHFISSDDKISRVSEFAYLFIPSDATPAKLIKEIADPRLMNFVRLWKYLDLHDNTIETSDFLEAKVAFHKKFSGPVACLLIALVGAPLGILPRRSSSNWNYVVLAMIIFQYYITQSTCTSIAETGKMDPFLAAWIPNVILLLISFVLIYRRSKTS